MGEHLINNCCTPLFVPSPIFNINIFTRTIPLIGPRMEDGSLKINIFT